MLAIFFSPVDFQFRLTPFGLFLPYPRRTSQRGCYWLVRSASQRMRPVHASYMDVDAPRQAPAALTRACGSLQSAHIYDPLPVVLIFFGGLHRCYCCLPQPTSSTMVLMRAPIYNMAAKILVPERGFSVRSIQADGEFRRRVFVHIPTISSLPQQQ